MRTSALPSVVRNISAISGTSSIGCSQTIRRAGKSRQFPNATMNVSR